MRFSFLIPLFVVSNFALASAANVPGACGGGLAATGMNYADYQALLEKEAKLAQAAAEENPGIRFLRPGDLDQLKREKYIIMIVGYSGGKEFDAQKAAYEAAMRMFLAHLDAEGLKDQVALLSGGTHLGVPGLVYDLGTPAGFTTIGVTPRAAGKHRPGRMDYLLVEGLAYGDESRRALDAADFVVAFGGGVQSQVEMLDAQVVRGLPVSRLEDGIIGVRRGEGMRAEELDRYVPGCTTAGAVAREFVDFVATRPFSQWLKKIEATTPTRRRTLAALRQEIGDRRIVGFTGWAKKNVPPADRLREVRALVKGFVAKLDPAKHVIATGGSHIPDAAEAFVHEALATEAALRGFKTVALVAHSIGREYQAFFPADYVVPVARTWDGFTYGWANAVDVAVSFGGGPTVVEQTRIAASRGIPTLYVPNNVPTADRAVAKIAGVRWVETADQFVVP